MKAIKSKNQIHSVRYLVGVLIIFVIGCSTDDYQLQKVFVENTHTHFVEVQHAHDFEDSEHTHEMSEYFPEEQMPEPVPPVPKNPFVEILLASEQVLALEGGRELLEIAVKPRITEAQKLAMVMESPPTEARRLLIEAYFTHEELVKTLRTEVESALEKAKQ
jgi:hypothetical protein